MTGDRMRGLAAAVGVCVRADRPAAIGCMALFTVRPLALVCTAYGLKLVVDAAAVRDVPTAVAVGAAIAAVNSAGFVAGLWGVRLAHRVMTGAGHAVDRELVRLSLRPVGIDHQRRRDHLDTVAVLAKEQVSLSESADVLALLLGATLRALCTVALLAAVSPWLLLVVVFAVPALLASSRAERVRQEALTATAEGDRRARTLFTLATTSAPARELRMHGIQREILARHTGLGVDGDRLLDRAARRAFALSALGWLVFTAGYAGAGLLVVVSAARGGVGVGDVVMVLMLLTSIVLQMTQTVRFAGLLNRCAAAGRGLVWLRRTAPPADRPRGAAPPDVLRDGITLCGLRFRYPGAATDVLAGVDLHLPAGTVIGLVGENGSGKSTLVALLTAMHQPDGGEILVDGTPLADLDSEKWRGRTTGLFQDFARLEFEVREAVGVGHLPALDDAAAVASALTRADADTVVAALPAGTRTQLGASFPHGTELSGGQWQRIGLARGMMRRSPLLQVFDEPTSAIDAETERALLRRHVAAAREYGATTGTVTVLVSHRFSSVRDADLVVVLDAGRVAEAGTHDELRAARGVYARLYELQAAGYRRTRRNPAMHATTEER
ncbi:ABC transporter ATP-binding protein [Actinophytocola sp. NPDC049390]|uniref:ABC transporter ATP-binding protein n=1 Tax=Actinophytocola sp. NPDC049390 TaxID=3363894 RepID=UPI00379B5DA3